MLCYFLTHEKKLHITFYCDANCICSCCHDGCWDTIWDYKTWRECTNYIVVPFPERCHGLADRADRPEVGHVKNLANCVHQNTGYHNLLKAFYMKDKDQNGKEAWVEWFRPEHMSWKL